MNGDKAEYTHLTQLQWGCNYLLPTTYQQHYSLATTSTLLHTPTTNSRHIPGEYYLTARCPHPRSGDQHSKFPFQVCGQEVANTDKKYIDTTLRHSQIGQESSSHIV